MAIVGEALSLLALKALIHVTTKAGATVTFKKGSTTMATKTANSSGVAELEVLSSDWGSWTVDVSWAVSGAGNATGSTTFIVSEATTYNKTISLRLWFVKDGDFVSGVSHSFSSEHASSGSFNDAGDYVNLHQNADRVDHWDAIAGYLGSAITFDGYWKSLVFETRERGYGVTGSTLAAGLTTGSGASPTFSYYVQLRGNGEHSSYNSKHTSTLNVSSVSGSYKVVVRGAMYDHWNQYSSAIISGPCDINIYNAYLSA